MKINISHDVYDISNRIKRIDKDYYIVYDTIRKKYEIHNTSQVDSSYCLTLPYDGLDARVLDYVYMTRVDNMDELLLKLDKDNDFLDADAKHDVVCRAQEYVEEEMKG